MFTIHNNKRIRTRAMNHDTSCKFQDSSCYDCSTVSITGLPNKRASKDISRLKNKISILVPDYTRSRLQVEMNNQFRKRRKSNVTFWKLSRNTIMINTGIFTLPLNTSTRRSLFTSMSWRLRAGDTHKSKTKTKSRVSAHTSAALGTSSHKISHLISPTFVCNVTDWDSPKPNHESVREKSYSELQK